MNKRYSANLYVIISILLGYFLSQVVFKEYANGVDSALTMNLLNIVNNVVITLLPLIIFIIFNGRKFTGFFGKVSAGKIGKYIIIAPVVWSASNYFNGQLNLLLKRFGLVMIEQLPKGNQTEVLFSGFLLACVIAPIFEELFYRGVVLSLLKGYGKNAAIIISALLFAFAHGSITVFGSPLILGIVTAYITLNCGSIWSAMIIHFVNNLLSWLVMSFSMKEEVSAAISIIMITVGAAWLVWALIKILRERNKFLDVLGQIWHYVKNPSWIIILANYIYMNTLIHG